MSQLLWYTSHFSFCEEYLHAPEYFFASLVPIVTEILGDAFPELRRDPQETISVLREEERQFRRTLVWWDCRKLTSWFASYLINLRLSQLEWNRCAMLCLLPWFLHKPTYNTGRLAAEDTLDVLFLKSKMGLLTVILHGGYMTHMDSLFILQVRHIFLKLIILLFALPCV